MKKNLLKRKIVNVAFVFLLVGCFALGAINVSAASVLDSYDFSGSAAALGGRYQSLEHLTGESANYVKVTINAKDGDNYDLRFIYTTTFPSERKILAEKKGIKAKGSSNTFYFIPQNGPCPGSSSQCIKVPVVNKISTANNVVDTYDVMYGIEVYNGSLLGGSVKVSGTYSFMNY